MTRAGDPSGTQHDGPSGEGGRSSTVDLRTEQLARLGVRVGDVAAELQVSLQLVLGSLDQLAVQVDRIARSSAPDAAEQAAVLVRLCREGTRRMAELVEQVAVHARGPGLTAAPGAVDVCRLVRVAVDVVARSIPRAPSIALDLSALPPLRTDERLLSLLAMQVVRYVVEQSLMTRDAVVDVTARPGHGGDGVEITVAGRGYRSTGDRPELGIGLARDLAGALRGDLEVMSSIEGTVAVLIRIPAMP